MGLLKLGSTRRGCQVNSSSSERRVFKCDEVVQLSLLFPVSTANVPIGARKDGLANVSWFEYSGVDWIQGTMKRVFLCRVQACLFL
mmetsp:Transcript_84456/g.247692  ORF Transcript_84456/g.247692 Transcript_84456/m.247692 type:complete len:86 (+) Transcript_84456:272-529(+)